MHLHNRVYKVTSFDSKPHIVATSTALLITAAVAAAAGTASYSQQNSANKSAKSAADTQMRMAQASQDALVAKETAAQEEVKNAAAVAESQAKAIVTNKKRAIARSETIYTSPLGVGGMADLSRKMLLGS